MSAVDEYVGHSGAGIITHSSGTNTVSNSLNLGYDHGANGTYNLSDLGQLYVNTYERIGLDGLATFNHTGGINSIANGQLLVGVGSSGTGTYNLSGTGQLSAKTEYISYTGTGTFNHSSGTNSVSDTLVVRSVFGTGIYNLRDTGELVASNEQIDGSGTFNQSGGKNTVSTKLNLSSNGIYNLTGGILILKSLTNDSANVAFKLGGGTLQASGNFTTTTPITLTGDGGNANIDTISYAVTLFGQLSGIGGLNKLGSGTLTLNTANTFTGAINFNAGSIKASALNRLGNGTVLDFNGGGLQFAGVFDPSVRTMTFQAGGATLDTQTYNITMANSIGNGGPGGLAKYGTGKLTLNSLINYTGNTTISGGTLEIAGGIAPSGTSLIDVQSGKAVFKTASVNKTSLNINTAALATFETVNGSHAVGSITGSGITQVDTGSSLSAASIFQNTLTVQSGATVTIRPLTGGPLGGEITPVPEPSALVPLAVAIFIAFCAFARNMKVDK